MKVLAKAIIIMIFIASFPLDEVSLLNASIPDLKVNENSVFSRARQNNPSISADSSGNLTLTWSDERNGHGDIYAQRFSSDGTALGSNFRVNDDVGCENQYNPSISADGSRNFIIVWWDDRSGGKNDGWDIYAQRFSSDGTALGINFRVNDDPSNGHDISPSISVDGSGNFIITWANILGIGFGDIYAQRYSSDGTALGNNFRVDDNQDDTFQLSPSIAVDDSGNFIIVWWDERSGDVNDGIYARRYSSDGTVLGSSFQVNDDTSNAIQRDPSISLDGSGNFIISWMDNRNGDFDVYVQRYSNNGTAMGTNYQVNDNAASMTQSHRTSISADNSGNFIIAWVDERNGHLDIYAQMYSSDGTALQSNFPVNDDTGNARQFHPSVSADNNGNFIIAWQDDRNGGENDDIFAQRYASDGTALNSNFQVNDDMGSEHQYHPSISVNSSGNFIIAWDDERNGHGDIYAQRYASADTALGNNFKVNDNQGTSRQHNASISLDDSGNCYITWIDERDAEYYYDIYAQRYSRDGTAPGGNFQVNENTAIVHRWLRTSISADNSGNFIIAWSDARNGNYDIYAQRYSSEGTVLGSNFQVNDVGSEHQYNPSISSDASGNFIIAWEDRRNGVSDIYAQRYAGDGTALGNNFKVNDDQSSYSPCISVDNSGNFIIAWKDYGIYNFDMYAQRYASDGTALGGNFQVNDHTGSVTYQGFPSISTDDGGKFIIAWDDERNGNPDIYAQRYANDGKALDGNFRITNTGEGTQRHPDVKLCNNQIYTTWEDNRAGGTGFDIWANVLNWNPVGISDDKRSQIASDFVLHQNYPNPFNPVTTIEVTLPITEHVQIEVYDITGQMIKTLLNQKMPTGNHEVEFNGSDLTSGIYFYQIQAGKFRVMKKMMLIK